MAGSAPWSVAPIGGADHTWPLKSEQQQERNQQREDAERLGNGETEDEVGELALSGGWIAQRGGEIVAKDGADADAGASHADAGNTGADIFGGHWIHDEAPFFEFGWKGGSVSGPGEGRRCGKC